MSWTRTVPSETDPGVVYTVKFNDDVLSCTCMAWRKQMAPITARTCKHLIKLFGADIERARAPESFAGLTAYRAPVSVRHDITPPMLFHSVRLKSDPKRFASGDGEDMSKFENWYFSVKLNGAFGRWQNGRMFSKSGRELHPPLRITDRLPRDVDLDGELYSPSMQKVRKALSNKWDEGENEVEFAVFDLVDTTLPYEKRLEKLIALQRQHGFRLIRQHKIEGAAEVLPQVMHDIEEHHEEGLVLRNPKGMYEPGARVYTTLKWKPTLLGEGLIKSVTKKKSGHRLTVRETDGTEFTLYVGGAKHSFFEGHPIRFQYHGRDESGKPELAQWVADV